MDEEQVSAIQPIYLVKVVGVLLVFGTMVAAAFIPHAAGLSSSATKLLMAGLIVGAAAITALLWRRYKNMDELQKILHHSACVATLSLLALACAVTGILQANDILPTFNQFWVFGAAITVWGVNLMLADRQYK